MLGCVQGRCLVDVAQREPEYLHEASSHKLFIYFLIYLFVQWCDMRAEAQSCRLGLNEQFLLFYKYNTWGIWSL